MKGSFAKLSTVGAFFFLFCFRPIFIARPSGGNGDDESYVQTLAFLLHHSPLEAMKGNTYSIGAPLAWWPTGIFAEIFSLLTRTPLNLFFVASVASAAIGFLGFRNLFLTGRKLGYSESNSFLGSLGFFLGCQLPYFLAGRGTLAHAAEFFFLTWPLRLACGSGSLDPIRQLFLSLACGFAVITRINDFGVYWLLLPIALIALRSISGLIQATRALLPGALLVAANFAFTRYNRVQSDHVFNHDPPSRLLEVTWENVRFQLTNFCYGNSGGLLWISPIFVLGVGLWVYLLRKSQKPCGLPQGFNLALGTLLAFNLYVIAIWQGYGGEYGYRYIFGTFPFLALVLMNALETIKARWIKIAVPILTAWGFYFFWVYSVHVETGMKESLQQGNVHVSLWNHDLVTRSILAFVEHPPMFFRCFGLSLFGGIGAHLSAHPKLANYALPMSDIWSAIILIPGSLGFFLGGEMLLKRLLKKSGLNPVQNDPPEIVGEVLRLKQSQEASQPRTHE